MLIQEKGIKTTHTHTHAQCVCAWVLLSWVQYLRMAGSVNLARKFPSPMPCPIERVLYLFSPAHVEWVTHSVLYVPATPLDSPYYQMGLGKFLLWLYGSLVSPLMIVCWLSAPALRLPVCRPRAGHGIRETLEEAESQGAALEWRIYGWMRGNKKSRPTKGRIRLDSQGYSILSN